MAKAKNEPVKEETLQKDTEDPTAESAVVKESEEAESLKAQLDAAQKALIPIQDENVQLKDEIRRLKAENKKISEDLASSLKSEAKAVGKVVEKLEGTYVVIDGKREEVHIGPRPFRDFIPEWRGRLFNDGCMTIVLERHG